MVHRADGSGAAFLFISYLSLKAPHWASEVGANDSVRWPVGVGEFGKTDEVFTRPGTGKTSDYITGRFG
jgi:ABC-type phosphate transport system substrate-binding protein